MKKLWGRGEGDNKTRGMMHQFMSKQELSLFAVDMKISMRHFITLSLAVAQTHLWIFFPSLAFMHYQ